MLNWRRLPWHWYALAFVLVLLDQFTKRWAVADLHYNSPFEITSFFSFTLRYNYGAAFSFLHDAGGWQRWLFGLIAVVFSILLVVWLARLKRGQTLESLGLACILGGALGNLYDRIVLGYVVDFIEFHYQGWYFPAFNIADSAITVGAACVILDMFMNRKHDG